jgi:hypothetical protein
MHSTERETSAKQLQNTRNYCKTNRHLPPEMQSFTRVYRFGHLLLIATSIGDVPPKLFLLDSGAADNVYRGRQRKRSRQSIVERTSRWGVSLGSVNEVYTAKKAILRFGHLSQQDQEMIAFDTTSQSENAGTEISGLLGFANVTVKQLSLVLCLQEMLPLVPNAESDRAELLAARVRPFLQAALKNPQHLEQ